MRPSRAICSKCRTWLRRCLSIVIGEGGSGGALAIGVCDHLIMLQFSVYSVISPEACASILWKSTEKKEIAAEAMGGTAERLYKLRLVDEVLKEPHGGAHRDPQLMAETMKQSIIKNLGELRNKPMTQLLDARQARLRGFGAFRDGCKLFRGNLHAALEASVPARSRRPGGGIERRCGFCRVAARGRGAGQEFSRTAAACAARRSRLANRRRQFRAACVALCEQLRVPLRVVPVEVSREAGVSLEAAARAARYAALGLEMQPRECLLTAHHREDQAETLLLQALRGAGVKGMAAMPVCRPLGSGWHVRPLLDVAHSDLLQFGERQSASADPMNQDLRFDRVYLRTADLAADPEALAGRGNRPDARRSAHGGGAAAAGGGRERGRGAPARRQCAVDSGLASLAAVEARQCRAPVVERAGPGSAFNRAAPRGVASGVRCRGRSSAGNRFRAARAAALSPAIVRHAADPPRLSEAQSWIPAVGSAVELGPGLGNLTWIAQRGGIAAERLPGSVIVRRRDGGETLKPASLARTQTLQHLCQARGVLPWMRDALPLVFAGDELIAVADLWLDAHWCLPKDAPGLGDRVEPCPTGHVIGLSSARRSANLNSRRIPIVPFGLRLIIRFEWRNQTIKSAVTHYESDLFLSPAAWFPRSVKASPQHL